METQNIPIDINSGKLLDWIINRRHCPRDWQVLSIREKINNAIQDMPVHEEIAKLLSGTHINYFHCKKILEILKETEADTKNLFGRYGSQRMKDWQEIVRLYEKDNIYLAEAAQMLMRNVTYEVPSLKKQIQKMEQMQNELEKKKFDYKKSENSARSEFQNLCKQLGISGENIKKELAGRIQELPTIYENITKNLKPLSSTIEFYTAFVEFTLGQPFSGGCVPLLKYLIDRGNTTTYEWTYGEPPLSITEPPLNFNVEEDEDPNKTIDGGIDFGDIPNQIDFNINDQINFGNDGDGVNQGVDIDWGEIDAADAGLGDQAIDFNISLEESGIVVEDAGNDGGAATGNEALTILDNPMTRNDFINNLFELEAFLKLRLYEFKSDNSKNLLSMSQMQETAPILQLATVDSVQAMLDNVQVVLSEILDSRVQNLHNIKHSSRFVDVLASSLKQKQSLIERMEIAQKLVQEKQEKTREESASLEPLLKVIIKKTKELQAEIERDISAKYNNRIVRLTGGVNTL